MGYHSRAKEWKLQTGRETFDGNEHTLRGDLLEPEAVAWFAEMFPFAKLSHVNEEQKFRIHPAYDWLGCTPDGFVDDIELLEIKCPANPVKDDWYMRYMPQIQGQMEITGTAACNLVAYIEGNVKAWRIERSKEYWKWMLPLLDEFWGYVQRDEEPPAFKRGGKPKFEGEFNIEVIYE